MADFCRILIIDDEFIMRQGMKHMIDWEKEGFQIVGEASNGKEGLELVEKLRPHIVLADIVMPVLDGIEFSAILHERYPEIRLIILSSYDKFEYVRTTLTNGASDYILKPTLNEENLLKALKKTAASIPGIDLKRNEHISYESRIERFLSGYQEKLDEMAFADFFPYTLYRMLGINLKQLCGGKKHKMESARNIIDSFFTDDISVVSLSVMSGEEYLCVLFNYRIKDDAAIICKASDSVSKLGLAYEDTFAVLSQSFTELSKLRMIFQNDVREMLGRQFYYPGQQLLVLENPADKSEIDRFDFERFSGCLNGGRLDEAAAMFGDYMAYLCKMQADAYKVKNLAKNLLYNYLAESERYGLPGDELKERYFIEIDQAKSSGEFLKTVAAVVSELITNEAGGAAREDARIAAIKNYINNHYEEQLELADLAEQFGFSYNYLSSYFKSYIQEGFSGYLNKIRIEKACELMKDRSQSIAQISGHVGYSDQSYFCRVFKKATGETPSAFRRKCRK